MSDNENVNGKVDGWWAASSDAGHEQVNLYEVVNGRESLLEVMTVTLEDFPTLEDFKIEVKRLFGGGIYAAVIRGQNGTFGKRPTFAISGRPIREKAEETTQAGQGNGIDRIAEVIAAGNANVMAVLAKLAEKPAGNGMTETLGMVEQVAAILGKTATPPAPAEKSMIERAMEKQFLAFMEKGLGGGAGEEGTDWARELFSAFAPVAAGMMTQGGAGADLEHDPVTPAADPQANALHKLRLLLASMVQLAEFEVTTAKAVEGIRKKAGEYWPMLEQVIQRPDALEMAAQMVPAVAEHLDWFEDFRTFVMTGGKKETSNGTTGGKQAARKKPAASGQPGAAVKRSSRNTANAEANG